MIRRLLSRFLTLLPIAALVAIAGWAFLSGDNMAAVAAIVGTGMVGRKV